MACKQGGHIIVCAEAPDGAAKFGKHLKNAENPQAVVDLFV